MNFFRGIQTAAFILFIIHCRITECRGKRQFYNNVQVASGSPIIYPEFSGFSRKREIPLDMIIRMNEAEDASDIFENFFYSEADNVTLTGISSRVGLVGVERTATITRAKMAVCMPELKTVSVKPEIDSTLFYHPSCIRIERCGGCCAHSLLTCTSVESEIVNVGVLVGEYKGGQRLVPKEYKIIPVEKHTKCKCDCKIQPENCTKSQRYNKKSCSCECNNSDSERKCYSESKNKIWNKDRCACLCREQLECQTGFYFDPISCACEAREGRIKPSQKPWIA